MSVSGNRLVVSGVHMVEEVSGIERLILVIVQVGNRRVGPEQPSHAI